MPNLFRDLQGRVWKPGESIPCSLADGSSISGIWGGSAQEEKLNWWLKTPGSQLAQTVPVAAVASKADDDGELIWGDAPAGACLFFVIDPVVLGRGYRLAKLVTTAASPNEQIYFRHDRAALYGRLRGDGGIEKISPTNCPPPKPRAQGELF